MKHIIDALIFSTFALVFTAVMLYDITGGAL